MGATILHKNPKIFPNPTSFDPSRWLQENSSDLEKYLVSFSKGPRSCLGIKYVFCVIYPLSILSKYHFNSLAWCELYLILGTVFRKLDLVPDNASYVLTFYLVLGCSFLNIFHRIENISFREYFVPIHRGRQFHAYVQGKAD